MGAKIKRFSKAVGGSLTAAFPVAGPNASAWKWRWAGTGGRRLRYICAAVQAVGEHLSPWPGDMTNDTHFTHVGRWDVTPASGGGPRHPPTSGGSAKNLSNLFAPLKGGSGFPIWNPTLSAPTDYGEERKKNLKKCTGIFHGLRYWCYIL